jgi:hypothetical protein
MRIGMLEVTFENIEGEEFTLMVATSNSVQVGDSIWVSANHSEIVKRIIKVEVIDRN